MYISSHLNFNYLAAPSMQCSMLITLIKLIIENLIAFTFDNCLSKGGEGNNVANDLEEEHFGQFDKKLLKRMVAQKTLKAVERSTSASTGLRKIIENFDEKTGVHPPSTAHTYQNAEKDQKEMIALVCGLKPFQEVPGRCHSSFPHMPRSPFDLVDIRILEQWLTTSKQKLSTVPDTPWDNEESGSEDTETDDD